MSDLAQTIVSTIRGLPSILGTLVTTASLTVAGVESYNTTTGVKSAVTTSVDLDVVIDKFELSEIDGSAVLYTDIKLIVFSDGVVVPTVKDQVVLKGFSYNIINVVPTFVGDTVLIYTLQVRR
jgi:hypothetical protein